VNHARGAPVIRGKRRSVDDALANDPALMRRHGGKVEVR
jgi:hypothetical protein